MQVTNSKKITNRTEAVQMAEIINYQVYIGDHIVLSEKSPELYFMILLNTFSSPVKYNLK